jgi:hypothetical protein
VKSVCDQWAFPVGGVSRWHPSKGSVVGISRQLGHWDVSTPGCVGKSTPEWLANGKWLANGDCNELQ